MLTIHHLGHSQSERVIWLCEELGLDYTLLHYARDTVTRLSPPELKALHPLGAAPVVQDGDLLLAESAAIVEYIISKHGDGRLWLGPDHPAYADFLYWFHFSNGNLQPAMGRLMMVNNAKLPEGHAVLSNAQGRLHKILNLVNVRLAQAPFLAGAEFTAADIMSVFSLTTMRLFQPLDLGPYANILAYLQRVGTRPGYLRAMAKGDPDLEPLLQ